MTDNVIKLNNNKTLKLKIETSDGKDTGEYLEFNFNDVTLLLKYQDMIEKERKNREWIRNQALILQKRDDVRGKKLLSRNEEELLKSVKVFFDREIDIYNMFLGENGVQKLLNGNPLEWTTLREIDKIIDEQIAPHFDDALTNTIAKIKDAYSYSSKKSKEVLKLNE